jgi:hypothetical protein
VIVAKLPPSSGSSFDNRSSGSAGLLIFSWLFVGLPLAWGVVQTIAKSLALFH